MIEEKDPDSLAWWQRGAIYQIAPLSFQDSDGDGKGDIPGIISRLDYLDWLGIGAVWLSPVYPSPMLDFGYDISDFTAIDPVFGSLQDFDRLLAGLHRHGIRLLLDLVPNHTSDQHPWFKESRSSRNSHKRDWYLWHDAGTDGGPPNSWLSRFGSSAWEWDEGTRQYYYHAFLEEQPDLNWHNPQVRRAVGDVLRFWMERGVDGFRVDASAVLAEDQLLRDEPPNPRADETTPPPDRHLRVFTDGRPETMGYLAGLREVTNEYPDRVLAGEVQGSIGRIGRFYGHRRPRFQLPLNYCLLDSKWDVLSMQAAIDAYLNAIPDGAWPDWVIGGHDKSRAATRFGRAQARLLAMLLLSLPGTPFFYAGDELGLPDMPVPQDRVKDPFGLRVPGFKLGRDPERTPMRWDTSDKAGFTTGEPWLPIGDDIADLNVATQRADSRSSLMLYRRLLALRRSEPALLAGSYAPLRNAGTVLRFRRRDRDCELLVALNFGDRRQEIALAAGTLLVSTHLDREEEKLGGTVALRPNEGAIIRLG